MKIDRTTISTLTAAMRARGVQELEIAEGEVSVRIALPDAASQGRHVHAAPETKEDIRVVYSTGVGQFLTRHPTRAMDFVTEDTVSANQIVGVVAVGSILRPVVTPVGGKIVRRLRISGDFVDFGAPLLELKSLS